MSSQFIRTLPAFLAVSLTMWALIIAAVLR